jgi:hypothetical protein
MAPGGSFIDPSTIQPGAEVYGTDGKRVGTVQEVYEDALMVQKGIFFVHDYFIPFSHVTRVSGERIDLVLSSDEVKRQDWAQRPGVSALGRGMQADPATDTQQGSLNTQNDVNPAGPGGGLASGMGTATSDYGAGTGMPGQMGGTQSDMPTQADVGSLGGGLHDAGSRSGDTYSEGDLDRD